MKARVIPVLLINDGGLVKSIGFDNYNYLGDPMNTVRLFNEMEVDELSVLDISASKESRGPDFDMIEDLVSNAFMPISYGGGITSIDDVKKLFFLGVEKVVVNNFLLLDRSFVKELVPLHGKQSIVGGVDVKRGLLGGYKVYNHVSNSNLKIDVVQHVKTLEEAGVGEIFINDVSQDGNMDGYDLRLIELLHDQVSVPIIFCGGASCLEDIRIAIRSGADAAAAGSLFVYKGRTKGILINYPSQKELHELLDNESKDVGI